MLRTFPDPHDVPNLILPVALPDSDFVDMDQVLTKLGNNPDALNWWRNFVADHDPPPSMLRVPDWYYDDFWHFHQREIEDELPMDLFLPAPVGEAPAITIRSDHQPPDLFRVGMNVLVEIEGPLVTGSNIVPYRRIIWAALIQAVYQDSRELRIFWYDATSPDAQTSNYILLAAEEEIRISMGSVLLRDFKFTNKKFIPLKIFKSAIAIYLQRTQDAAIPALEVEDAENEDSVESD